ncbi:hypothetical protein GCM10023347_18740 [Streptomyces chumphonensis]|uniref:DUF1540 domain-containing protein n=1 Tax=Streptomyces chumphonensis TaxID=1214925 RepID=A0A927EXG5_9ACTN|nr:DUF1540 domain-containing protein [Streptomyces chumphonensis]MBD3931780.1 DUF1540 domain-containing protein [Streptomyces chumphonensis]
MEMPVVRECTVEECVYNRDQACHAQAITVGDMRHPHCDTYLNAPAKGGDPNSTGRVGACKVANCRHNEQFECRAPGITVGHVESAVDCMTYAPA